MGPGEVRKANERRTFRDIGPLRAALEEEVQLLLHAHRDCLRNRGQDSTKISFDCGDGYYGEAFGVMRALAILGYGYIDGPTNIPHPVKDIWNLKWWFAELQQTVLAQENFDGSNECNWCLERYGKDAVRKGRGDEVQGDK